MRSRNLVLVGIVASIAAVLVFGIGGTSTPSEAQRAAARERIRAVVPAPISPARTPDRTVIDLDGFQSADAVFTSVGPTSDWPEHELLGLYRALMKRDLLEDDLTSFFPWFVCDQRCDGDAPAWSGPRSSCLEQCALDRLSRDDSLHAARFVSVVANHTGNVALYEDIVLAYPDLWQERRDRIGTGRARGIAALWWGDTMRDHAPRLQRSLYGFGRANDDGVMGSAALMASGWTACVMVGDRPVCPQH